MDQLENLKKQANLYLEIIKKEFNINTNLKNLEIKIDDNKSLFPTSMNNIIYLPKSYKALLKELKKIPKFGYNKNHSHFKKDEINNKKTYFDFLKHIYIAGLSEEEYYKELILHELISMCSINEDSSLKRGLVELKTRELAQKYNLITNWCLNSKELEIALKMQELLGQELINKIIFTKSKRDLYVNIGAELYGVYNSIEEQMEIENEKQLKRDGLIRSTIEKSKINYKSATISLDFYEVYINRTLKIKKWA